MHAAPYCKKYENTVLWVNGQKYIFNSMTDRHTFSKISKTPLNNDKKEKIYCSHTFR